MGGALDCNWRSSSAYSGGSASGMVARIWAAFMSGPLRPPSAAFNSAEWRPWSRSRPSMRAPTSCAANPPTLAPTRA